LGRFGEAKNLLAPCRNSKPGPSRP